MKHATLPTRWDPLVRSTIGFSLSVLISLNLLLLYKKALGLENATHVLYYPQLAWSFLHGRLDVAGALASDVDLSPFHGHVYAYWPPLTALLMMPLVALRGLAQFPQRLFAIAFGALNAGLFFLLAERLRRLRSGPAWLPAAAAAVFGFGTSNLTFAVVANHWYLGQLTATPFVLLGLWFGLSRRPERRTASAAAAGVCFAIATIGRQHLLLSWPLWAFLAVSNESFRLPRLESLPRNRPLVGRALWVTIPALGLLAAMFVYNHARFGRWFENGLSYHTMDLALRPLYAKHGYFSLTYLPRNVYYLIVRPPGMEKVDGLWFAMGFGIFYQCPMLLLAFRRRLRSQLPDLARAVWIATALTSMPIFMLMSPGYSQFGARYLFDVVPFLAVLVLADISPTDRRWFIGLGLVSIVLNALGPLAMLRDWRI